MGIRSNISRTWARHDKRLAENELERETIGVELPSIGRKAAWMTRVRRGRVPSLAERAVHGEAEVAKAAAEAEADARSGGIELE